jgi:hypothetical protein
MPTLIHTMPLEPQWNGRPIGRTSNGMVVGASHVTIQGLKVLGAPVVEDAGQGRGQSDLPDRPVRRHPRRPRDQPVLLRRRRGDRAQPPADHRQRHGDEHPPLHLYRTKLCVVWWHVGSTGHAMRNCIVYGCYQGGPWTAVVAGDLDFRNNVVAECRNAWVQTEMGPVDADASAGVPGANGRPFRKDPPPTNGKYRIVDSLFARNHRLAVSGTGSNLGFRASTPSS